MGFKRKDVQKCCICKQGLMKSGVPIFSRIKIQSMGFDLKALERQQGLEMMIGHVQIAQVMGPDEDLAEATGAEVTGLVCFTCETDPALIRNLYEELSNNESDGEEE